MSSARVSPPNVPPLLPRIPDYHQKAHELDPIPLMLRCIYYYDYYYDCGWNLLETVPGIRIELVCVQA